MCFNCQKCQRSAISKAGFLSNSTSTASQTWLSQPRALPQVVTWDSHSSPVQRCADVQSRVPWPAPKSHSRIQGTAVAYKMCMYRRELTQEWQKQGWEEPSRAQPNTDNHSWAQWSGSRQHDVDNPAFWGICPSLFRFPAPGRGNTSYREQILSCLWLSSQIELSWGAEHLSCVKHLLFCNFWYQYYCHCLHFLFLSLVVISNHNLHLYPPSHWSRVGKMGVAYLGV